MPPRSAPESVDAYISSLAPDVQAIFQRIRATVHKVAPQAQETISYGMPAFRLHGILLYFAAFKHHVGLYPPVSGDAALERAVAPYAGPKGNLRFPLDRPIPFELIERVARLGLKQDLDKAGARSGNP
jgi:uncharacterized protein YdhG (YjbR/CyaY superfamily)